jgi:hypothetical protein
LIFLALTSRLLNTPVISCSQRPVFGWEIPHSSGNTKILSLEAYYALSAMSEKALAYSQETAEESVLGHL